MAYKVDIKYDGKHGAWVKVSKISCDKRLISGCRIKYVICLFGSIEKRRKELHKRL
jgi:hypothetical protein